MNHAEGHVGDAAHADGAGRALGEVDDPATHERPPVVDPHHHGAAVALVLHSTRVPKGRLRWAAVMPLGLKRSPLAVWRPLPYQEAPPLWAAAGRLARVTTVPARAAAIRTGLIYIRSCSVVSDGRQKEFERGQNETG